MHNVLVLYDFSQKWCKTALLLVGLCTPSLDCMNNEIQHNKISKQRCSFTNQEGIVDSVIDELGAHTFFSPKLLHYVLKKNKDCINENIVKYFISHKDVLKKKLYQKNNSRRETLNVLCTPLRLALLLGNDFVAAGLFFAGATAETAYDQTMLLQLALRHNDDFSTPHFRELFDRSGLIQHSIELNGKPFQHACYYDKKTASKALFKKVMLYAVQDDMLENSMLT